MTVRAATSRSSLYTRYSRLHNSKPPHANAKLMVVTFCYGRTLLRTTVAEGRCVETRPA
jgi:hypothetical protein